MPWPVLRQNGFLLDATAWNEVVAGLSAWAGDVNAGTHNLSNVGVLTFGAGGYVNNGFRVHVAADQNLTFQTGAGEGFRLNSHNDAGNANTPLAMVASSYYFGGGNVGIGSTNMLARLHVSRDEDDGVLYIHQYRNNGGAASAVQIIDDRGFGGDNSGNVVYVRGWAGGGSTGNLFSFNSFLGASDIPVLVGTLAGNVGIGTATPMSRLSLGHGTLNISQRIAVYEGTDGYFFRGIGFCNVGPAAYGLGLFGKAVSGLPTTPDLLINDAGYVGLGTVLPVAPFHIAMAAVVGDSPIMRLGYQGQDAVHNLVLRKNVSSGVVKYAFDITNESLVFSNNLVLDRGNVGIGTAPDYKLVIATGYAAGVIRIGSEGDYMTRIKSDTHLALQTGMGADILHINNGIETFRTNYQGYVVQSVPNVATFDALLANGHLSIWFDEAGNRLAFKCKTSAGVIKTGYVAVS